MVWHGALRIASEGQADIVVIHCCHTCQRWNLPCIQARKKWTTRIREDTHTRHGPTPLWRVEQFSETRMTKEPGALPNGEVARPCKEKNTDTRQNKKPLHMGVSFF